MKGNLILIKFAELENDYIYEKVMKLNQLKENSTKIFSKIFPSGYQTSFKLYRKILLDRVQLQV